MMKHLITTCFLYISILCLTVWIIGFGIFCFYALSFKFQPAEKTDAIVVLTGGGERVQTALNLLNDKYSDNLLISGVNQSVKKSELVGSLSPDLMEQVTLGYMAKDTRGNAKEIAEWVQDKKIQTILLVTSFYHMPRSIFEVLKESPDLKVIPLPVFPKSFNDSVDWIRTRYAWLLFVEYHKFIATKLQNYIERIYQ